MPKKSVDVPEQLSRNRGLQRVGFPLAITGSLSRMPSLQWQSVGLTSPRKFTPITFRRWNRNTIDCAVSARRCALQKQLTGGDYVRFLFLAVDTRFAIASRQAASDTRVIPAWRTANDVGTLGNSYIMKQASTEQFLVSLRRILAGNIFVSETVSNRLL